MLALARREAEAQGIDVVLHEASMETMDLGRRYRSIFLAGPTFNLLADDGTTGRALERIRAHLADGGAALVPLFIPQPATAGELGRTREATDDAGETIRVTPVSEERDEVERVHTTVLRYERGDEVLERPWALHWHTQEGFRALAEAAGLATAAVLDPNGEPAAEDTELFVFWLTATSSKTAVRHGVASRHVAEPEDPG
jgi:hypothetical protein